MMALLLSLVIAIPSPSPAPSLSPTFGDCDPAAVASMAGLPVGSATTTDPQLSNLVSMLTLADLIGAWDNEPELTVFAPVNSAFDKIPTEELAALTGNQRLLNYLAIPHRLGPGELAGTHQTLAGQALTVTGLGTWLQVNRVANVTCGNVPTYNATVYYIDTVLMPW